MVLAMVTIGFDPSPYVYSRDIYVYIYRDINYIHIHAYVNIIMVEYRMWIYCINIYI